MKIKGGQICEQKYSPYNFDTEEVTILKFETRKARHIIEADASLHAYTFWTKYPLPHISFKNELLCYSLKYVFNWLVRLYMVSILMANYGSDHK